MGDWGTRRGRLERLYQKSDAGTEALKTPLVLKILHQVQAEFIPDVK